MKVTKWSFFLIIIMVFFLAACSADNSENAGTNEGGDDQKSVEIEWLTHTPDTEETTRIIEEEIIAPFEANHPGVKIKWIQNADPDAIARQQLAAGSGPDIVITDGPTVLKQFAKSGYLLELNQYADQFGWEDRFYDWAYSTGFDGDTLYGLPSEYETLVVWYNKEMFDANGWSVPNTFEEFMVLNETIQQTGTIPFAFGTTDFRPSNEWWLSVVYNSYLGPEEFKKVLKNDVPWTSELVVEATEMWADIWKKGWITDKQSHAISLDDAWDLFNHEQTAMKMEGTWALSRFIDDQSPFEVDFFLMPAWRDGVETNIAMALGESSGVNAKTNYPDETAAFLDWIYSEEIATLMVSQGRFYPIDDIEVKNIEGLDPLVAKVYDVIDGAVEQGNTGFASWTYWPPSAQYYLWDNIDAVFLEQISVEEYLEKAQSEADKDEENGLIFDFTD